MADYSQRTVEQLQEELRDRDLKVSGSKDELVARLEEDDRGQGGGSQAGAEESGDARGRRGPLAEVVQRIREGLVEVTGARVERVTGLAEVDDGWTARVDVLEVSRVPPSTDVLASYEVSTDGEGNVHGFERVRRFRRSEADEQ